MSKKVEIVKVSSMGDGVAYTFDDIDNYFCRGGACTNGGAVDGERALSHAFLMDSFRKVMGRTLTIIDASVLDKQQNKAIKDLVRGIFSDEMSFAGEMAFDQEVIQRMVPDRVEDIMEVSVEEVLGVKQG